MSHFEIDSAAQAQADARERRERIAVRCLQGMWGNTDFSEYEYVEMAITAVASADALIAELDKDVEP